MFHHATISYWALDKRFNLLTLWLVTIGIPLMNLTIVCVVFHVSVSISECSFTPGHGNVKFPPAIAEIVFTGMFCSSNEDTETNKISWRPEKTNRREKIEFVFCYDTWNDFSFSQCYVGFGLMLCEHEKGRREKYHNEKFHARAHGRKTKKGNKKRRILCQCSLKSRRSLRSCFLSCAKRGFQLFLRRGFCL